MKAKPSPEKIIELYLSGKDTYQVAEECESNQTFVLNTLKQHNIPRRSTYSYTTKYIPNEKFFDMIDSEEKAYTLGFFYADGNNYVKGNHSYEVSIKLQEGDRAILERFRDMLSPQSEVYFSKKQKETYQNQYGLRINSKLMAEQLIKLGCVRAKSLILTFPEWLIDPKLQQHFIRGYFDGDGSLYSKKPSHTGHINYEWKLTSTDMFCAKVKQIIEDTLKIRSYQSICHPKDNKITSKLTVGGNRQIRKVLDWLYSGATIYLERKYQKYQEMIKNSAHLRNHASNLDR